MYPMYSLLHKTFDFGQLYFDANYLLYLYIERLKISRKYKIITTQEEISKILINHSLIVGLCLHQLLQ